MKKILAMLIAVLLCLSLTGCKVNLNAEELLSAPRINAEQNEIMRALDGFIDSAVKLKYPISGGDRAPIQFFDLDGDGRDEAVVCYCIIAETPYVRIAVFKQSFTGWVGINWIETSGTDVTSIGLISTESGNQLLVELQSINRTDHQAVAYSFSAAAGLSVAYEITGTKILASDFDGDGHDEICAVVSRGVEGPYQLKLIKSTGQGLIVANTVGLNRRMLDCVGLRVGYTADDKISIIVEENIGGGLQASEIFVCDQSGQLVPAAAGIFDHSIRAIDTVGCGPIFADQKTTYIPEMFTSSVSGVGTRWYRWRYIKAGELRLAFSTYIDLNIGYGIAVPSGYDGNLVFRAVKEDSRRFEIVFYENGQELRLCELKIMPITDNGDIYINAGFKRVGANDRYGFYLRADHSPETDTFILKNFIVL